MKTYSTMLEALNDLKLRGFDVDFNLTKDAIHSSSRDVTLNPEDFEIVELHRFEGESDPGDNSIVYAIQSEKYHIKGVMVDAYGVYAEDISEELLKKLNTPE